MRELSFEPKPKGYLGPKQLEEMADERKFLERQMADPLIEDKGDVARLLRRLTTQVAAQTPPKLEGDDLDRAMAQRRELEAWIPEGMPSDVEMRLNADGTVDQHIAWERAKKNAILFWKDLMKMTEYGNTDIDLCNVERMRPKTSSRSMHSAQIPSQAYHFAPDTQEYRQKWDATFGEKTPDQILREHMDQGERMAAIESRLDQLAEDPSSDDEPIATEPVPVPEPVEVDAAPRLGSVEA